jgi:Tol biopolymer transport system component
MKAYRFLPGREMFAAAVLLAWILPARAQDEFPHPELVWHTIETPHFLVHYHDGAERTARVTAKIAEDIYEPVTTLYHHTPSQKVSFVIRDHDDISNGGAYFFDNKIEIYAPSMDFAFRGIHNWLRNVITHEFTHIVQIQTSMKFGRSVPAVYLQWLNYESERRPDVLYGYPNVIVSYPISGFVVPAWFAEGVAQYNRTDLRYDFWDSHRDMILRSYALDSTMLTWEQMAVFGKTSLGNESSYNAGFAFVSYIASKYGESKLEEISRNLSTLTEVTIGGAIRRAVGKDGAEVYDEWRQEIQKEYAARIAGVRTSLREGAPFRIVPDDEDATRTRGRTESMMSPPFAMPVPQSPYECNFNEVETGFANLYPVFSPDGKRVAYVSTGAGDYFLHSALHVSTLASMHDTLVQAGVRTAPCWSPDGTRLFYAKNTHDNPHWSLQNDIYQLDLATGEEKRITRGRRATSPAVSPDGKTIAYVVNADGTTNLALANIDGSGERPVTHYTQGEQVYNPKWSPSGDRIVFDYSISDGRDIAEVKPDGSDLRFLVTGPDDAQAGTFSSDGRRILFASDRTGIFNLYTCDLATGAIAQRSNVPGGAFCPTSNGSTIVYSAYTSKGYKLYTLADSTAGSPFEVYAGEAGIPPATSGAHAPTGTTQFDWQALRSYDDTQLAPVQAKKYGNIFTSLSIIPFDRVDNYTTHGSVLDIIKPGAYIISNDVADKVGLFGGAAINRKLERDLFLQVFYRDRLPLLYSLGLEPVTSAELYNVSRQTGATLTLPLYHIPIDVTYNLFEFDFAMNQAVGSQATTIEARYSHSRYSSDIGNFLNPYTNQIAAGSSELYLIANAFALTVRLDQVAITRTMDINPVGRKILLKLSRELNQFNGDNEYEVTSSGTIKPKYKDINFTRVELNWKEYLPMPVRNHTLSLAFHGGTILEPSVDEFFNFYASGLIGMKGYPFYAIGGNAMAALNLTYRFPLFQNIDLRVAQLYFDKLYGAVYGDFGNAWTGIKPRLSDWKSDAGAELRLESSSFYAFPTRIFFNASYGFNTFSTYIRSRDALVTYGGEWRFYFGILFGFDFD